MLRRSRSFPKNFLIIYFKIKNCSNRSISTLARLDFSKNKKKKKTQTDRKRHESGGTKRRTKERGRGRKKKIKSIVTRTSTFQSIGLHRVFFHVRLPVSIPCSRPLLIHLPTDIRPGSYLPGHFSISSDEFPVSLSVYTTPQKYLDTWFIRFL